LNAQTMAVVLVRPFSSLPWLHLPVLGTNLRWGIKP
jgi:hypothetical protein